MVTLLALLACHREDAAVTAGAKDVEPSAILDGQAVIFVGVETMFDAGASAGATFTWDFGDGTTTTFDAADGAHAEHTYTEPGRYTVRLTAASGDGRSDTASATRVAVYEPLTTPPTSSGRLALADGVVYAAVPDADVVVIVEGDRVVDRLAVCGHPVAVSAAGGFVAVACRDDAVQLWNTTTRALVWETTLRWGARPVAVTTTAAGAVTVALGGIGEVAQISDGSVYSFATAPDAGGLATVGTHVYAPRFRSPDAGGEVYHYSDDDPGPSLRTHTLSPDLGPDSDTGARGVPTLLGAVAVSPDGRTLVVAGAKANMDRGLVRDGLALTHETTTRASLRVLDATRGDELLRDHFDNRDRVGAVAFTPLGDKLLVAHLGAGIVDVLDPVTLARIGGFQAVGVGLDGVATDGETAWVLASIDRELVAYDLGGVNGEVERARVPLLDVEPLDAELLLGARVFHDAGDPRMSADAYVSCASCHPDGGTDARTWDFTDRGEGLRDTQALFAMPAAGPFHWSANFDEVQDFDNAIRAHQAGAGFLSATDFAATQDPLGEPKEGRSAELDALAAYVRSLAAEVPRSPWREVDGAPTEAGLRGRDIFVSSACETCHAGSEATDAGWNEIEPDASPSPVLHDVGTLLDTSGGRAGEPLTGLRTPSLRGLFATAPYLHDGRAATVEDALAAHGVVLDTAEAADLVHYLLELEGAP